MTYIIDNANILNGRELSNFSILVKENRIDVIGTSFKRYLFMKMNMEPYIMTPTFVALDSQIPIQGQLPVFKKYMTEELLMRGCTTLLTYVDIQYENELVPQIKKMVTALINSPIDFIIGVKIPLRLLTTSFLRQCKKEKIPAIFVVLDEHSNLEVAPWGWLREAIFPYNAPIIPISSSKNIKSSKQILASWRVKVQAEKMPALIEELHEKIPLSQTVLNKIGIYPKKGCLKHGAELSYNLYLKSHEIMKVDANELFLYHSNRLLITVYKGKVVRSGEEVIYKPGCGEHVKIQTPAYSSFV
jgi:hypothetical protein